MRKSKFATIDKIYTKKGNKFVSKFQNRLGSSWTMSHLIHDSLEEAEKEIATYFASSELIIDRQVTEDGN